MVKFDLFIIKGQIPVAESIAVVVPFRFEGCAKSSSVATSVTSLKDENKAHIIQIEMFAIDEGLSHPRRSGNES